MKYGRQTVNSWLMNFFVGTEKTSVKTRGGGQMVSINYISGRPETRYILEGWQCQLTIQLFQGQLFGFSDEAEYHKPRDEVESRVETDQLRSGRKKNVREFWPPRGISSGYVVPLTSTSRSHDSLHSREGQSEDTSYTHSQREISVDLDWIGKCFTESVVDANGPGHSLLTLDCGEHFCRVLECDRPFTQRVADSKEVDESRK